jgi:hypothetical protein
MVDHPLACIAQEYLLSFANVTNVEKSRSSCICHMQYNSFKSLKINYSKIKTLSAVHVVGRPM